MADDKKAKEEEQAKSGKARIAATRVKVGEKWYAAGDEVSFSDAEMEKAIEEAGGLQMPEQKK